MQKNLLRVLYFLFSVFIVVVSIPNSSVSAENKVYVFPETGRKPFLEAINSAQHTIYMAAYQFSDREIINALRQAADRNVQIKILGLTPNLKKVRVERCM